MKATAIQRFNKADQAERAVAFTRTPFTKQEGEPVISPSPHATYGEMLTDHSYPYQTLNNVKTGAVPNSGNGPEVSHETNLLGPVKNGSISAGTGRSQSTSRAPIGGDAVKTLYQLLNGRNQRYSGSLQLFASENSLGTRSCPQIFRPARFGHRTKLSFRSSKYRSIASLAASAEG